MRPTLALIAIILAGCRANDSGAERRVGQLPTAHAAAIRDSVRTMLETFTRLSAEAKWDSAATFYDSDSTFRWVESGAIAARSAQTIADKLAAMPPGMRVVTRYDGLEIQPLAPGLALVMSPFATHFGDTSATAPRFGGVLSMVIVHREAGWRFLFGHAS